MKERISSIVKSFLSAYAMTIPFQLPLQREYYESTVDYLTASVYELLGSYNFTFVLIAILSFICYEKGRQNGYKYGVAVKIPSGFFAISLVLGRSFYETNSWAYCFGSSVNFIKTVLVLCGFYFLFHMLAECLFRLFDTKTYTGVSDNFFAKHAFGKTFGILALVYSLVLLLSFPGNLCWDVIGQIEQFTVEGTGFSQHHPLMHTILVGGLTQLGELLFGSKEVGLFLYMILQNVMIITALSATIWVLAKKSVRPGILWALILLYCISPVYTNLSSTAIKDIPFTAFVIGYMICYALLLEKPERIHSKKFVLLFIAIQIGCIYMRNNGLPLIVLCGMAAVIFLWKRYNKKERFISIATLLLIGVFVAKLSLVMVATILGAKEGGQAEMFSLPMQQTARYLVYYGDELSEEERLGIEGVFGNAKYVADAYDPDIADPVKALFDNEAETGEVLAYFKAWFLGFCKHPMVYLEAFLNHVYGWFTPGVTSALRYETAYEAIGQGMLFPMAEKVMIFLYRFMDCIPILGILQNVGFYVWILILMSAYTIKKKKGAALMAFVPLWISLLVCMASPCFFLHPRYALPIIMGIPFLAVFTLCSSKQDARG